MADPMRDYPEKRERDLEERTRILMAALAGLQPFARHTDDCRGGDGSSQCACGYLAAYTAAQEAYEQ
jgi:hypothetical protein